MPSLPSRYQSQVDAQANRRIIEQPTFAPDTSMGDALTKVGQVGLEVAGRIQKAQTDQELVKAEIDARTRLDRLKRDLEADAETPEVALPDRWRQESEAILKDVSGKIGSTRARTLWMDRAKGWQGDGENWTVDLSRKRSVEKLRAEDIGLMTTLGNEAGDLTLGADTYAKKLEAVSAGIEAKRAAGFYAADDAARYMADVAALGMKDRTIRFTSNLDALIKDGRVAEAEALYQAQMGMNRQGQSTVEPETLAKVKSGLDQSKQEFAVVEQGDAIWEKSGGDYGKAIAMVADIKDAPLRLKVEARIGQKVAQAKAAEDARQDTLETAMWEHVEGGGTIMNAPPSLRADISPSRLGSIRAFESARDAESAMTAAQKAARDLESKIVKSSLDWLSRDNPSAFMNPDAWSAEYKAAYATMSSADQLAVMNKIDDMRQTGVTADAVDKVMQDAVKAAQRFAPSIMNSDKANAEAKFKFEGILYENARKLSADRGGQPISPEDARKIVLRSMGEFDAKKYGEGVNMALGFDADVYRRVKAQLAAKQGGEPTKEEVYAAYQSVMAD
jgi:hypothetical protein